MKAGKIFKWKKKSRQGGSEIRQNGNLSIYVLYECMKLSRTSLINKTVLHFIALSIDSSIR